MGERVAQNGELTVVLIPPCRYPGTVVDVVPNRERYVVLYDDGEQEVLKYGQEKVRLLPKGRG